MKTINLVGAGLIGRERLNAVQKLQARGFEVRVGCVHDPLNPRLHELTAQGLAAEPELERFLSLPADLIIIACPHDVAAVLACQALRAGHAILIEKPLGRSLDEAEQIAEAAGKNARVHVGLNYRFMRGVATLVSDWQNRRFGQPISLRLQIGHGGKPGDEASWKLDPVRCGGGALLDPGIHLLDLVTCLTGDDVDIRGVNSWHGFWRTGIEEHVELLLRSGGIGVTVETSVVRWRSHFEIFALGTEGYGHVEGRGRSYGVQRYCRGRRWGWQTAASQAASEELVVEDSCDNAFADELAVCLGLQSPGVVPAADLRSGLAMMRLYQQCRDALIAETSERSHS